MPACDRHRPCFLGLCLAQAGQVKILTRPGRPPKQSSYDSFSWTTPKVAHVHEKDSLPSVASLTNSSNDTVGTGLTRIEIWVHSSLESWSIEQYYPKMEADVSKSYNLFTKITNVLL